MKIQLVKHYDNEGIVHYYVKAEDQIVEGTIRHTLEGALRAFEEAKEKLMKGRTVILFEEEI